MRLQYDMDNADVERRMIARVMGGVIPRVTKYGDAEAVGIPYGEAFPEMLVDPKDNKEVIQRCHDRKIFPMYHQEESWAPDGFRWSQGQTSLCWTFSGTGDLMNCRAREGRPTVMLGPSSAGYLVNWQNRGYYLEAFVRGAQDRGIAPLSFLPSITSLDRRRFKKGWEEEAMKYRLAKDGVWDSSPRNMLQHCLSQLRLGVSLYAAWNRMGHAMSVVGLLWDERKYNNVIWVVRNSHNESEPIEMSGRNAEPDEALGFNSTLNV